MARYKEKRKTKDAKFLGLLVFRGLLPSDTHYVFYIPVFRHYIVGCFFWTVGITPYSTAVMVS